MLCLQLIDLLHACFTVVVLQPSVWILPDLPLYLFKYYVKFNQLFMQTKWWNKST